MSASEVKEIFQSWNGIVVHYDADGLYHNLEGPAITWPNGSEVWFVHGAITRDPDDGPAVTWTGHDDPRHATCSSACAEFNDWDLCETSPLGYQAWMVAGQLNRWHGLPAEVSVGNSQAWLIDGWEHNWSGPARLFYWNSGDPAAPDYMEWNLHGFGTSDIEDITRDRLPHTRRLKKRLDVAWSDRTIDKNRAQRLLAPLTGVSRLWIIKVLLANPSPRLSPDTRAFLGLQAMSIPVPEDFYQ